MTQQRRVLEIFAIGDEQVRESESSISAPEKLPESKSQVAECPPLVWNQR